MIVFVRGEHFHCTTTKNLLSENEELFIYVNSKLIKCMKN